MGRHYREKPDLLWCYIEDGGGDRDRTCDLLNANQMLSQLSYTPTDFILSKSYCPGKLLYYIYYFISIGLFTHYSIHLYYSFILFILHDHCLMLDPLMLDPKIIDIYLKHIIFYLIFF